MERRRPGGDRREAPLKAPRSPRRSTIEMVTLLCTVRNCARPLARAERTFVCGNRHSFDVARSGYVNLLQPQDRRSRTPGDSAEAVKARRRLADRGILEPLLRPMIDLLRLRSSDAILDAGCGDGYHLAAFRAAFGCESHGTDISTAAIDLAARRHRDCHWTIANADRFLPYVDGSFAALTSITSRLNAAEFRRVLAGDGVLLLAVPGPDDLIELREAVLGEGKTLDRVKQVEGFELVERTRVTHRAPLDRAAVMDIMTSSYRGVRKNQRARLDALADGIGVTMDREVLVLRPTRT